MGQIKNIKLHIVTDIKNLNNNNSNNMVRLLQPQPGKVYKKDPWARLEAWRYRPEFSAMSRFKSIWPGLWWGVGAFVVAATLEEGYNYLYKKDDDHHHGH